MATILCVTSGPAGSVYSIIELARRLAGAGHRLTFCGLPHARGLAEYHDLEFLEIDPSRYEEFLEADATNGALHRLRNLRSRRERAQDSMSVGTFVSTVRRLDPDLVLIDGEMYEHIIAVSGTGASIALLNTFASIWRQPGQPPPHHMVRPGIGWKGTRAGISLLWLELRFRKWWVAMSHWIRRVGCDRLSVLRQLARETGFDFRRETDASQWLIPFTFPRFRVLSLHALEFEFPHDLPERVHFVGPMVLESRTDRAMADEDGATLAAILERRRRANGQRKLIFAGFGSFFTTDLDFLNSLFGVVADREDWDLVISLGDRIAPAELGRLPERVHAFSWVPQTRVLRHADVAVTHGGINTIDECVVYGVPMLVYCGFETDMAGNTARIVHHGIGIAGDRRRDSTLVIRSHIDRLLHEPSFGRNILRLQRAYAAYAEDHVAERTVESLLAQESRGGTFATSGVVA